MKIKDMSQSKFESAQKKLEAVFALVYIYGQDNWLFKNEERDLFAKILDSKIETHEAYRAALDTFLSSENIKQQEKIFLIVDTLLKRFRDSSVSASAEQLHLMSPFHASRKRHKRVISEPSSPHGSYAESEAESEKIEGDTENVDLISPKIDVPSEIGPSELIQSTNLGDSLYSQNSQHSIETEIFQPFEDADNGSELDSGEATPTSHYMSMSMSMSSKFSHVLAQGLSVTLGSMPTFIEQGEEVDTRWNIVRRAALAQQDEWVTQADENDKRQFAQRNRNDLLEEILLPRDFFSAFNRLVAQINLNSPYSQRNVIENGLLELCEIYENWKSKFDQIDSGYAKYFPTHLALEAVYPKVLTSDEMKEMDRNARIQHVIKSILGYMWQHKKDAKIIPDDMLEIQIQMACHGAGLEDNQAVELCGKVFGLTKAPSNQVTPAKELIKTTSFYTESNKEFKNVVLQAQKNARLWNPKSLPKLLVEIGDLNPSVENVLFLLQNAEKHKALQKTQLDVQNYLLKQSEYEQNIANSWIDNLRKASINELSSSVQLSVYQILGVLAKEKALKQKEILLSSKPGRNDIFARKNYNNAEKNFAYYSNIQRLCSLRVEYLRVLPKGNVSWIDNTLKQDEIKPEDLNHAITHAQKDFLDAGQDLQPWWNKQVKLYEIPISDEEALKKVGSVLFIYWQYFEGTSQSLSFFSGSLGLATKGNEWLKVSYSKMREELKSGKFSGSDARKVLEKFHKNRAIIEETVKEYQPRWAEVVAFEFEAYVRDKLDKFQKENPDFSDKSLLEILNSAASSFTEESGFAFILRPYEVENWYNSKLPINNSPSDQDKQQMLAFNKIYRDHKSLILAKIVQACRDFSFINSDQLKEVVSANLFAMLFNCDRQQQSIVSDEIRQWCEFEGNKAEFHRQYEVARVKKVEEEREELEFVTPLSSPLKSNVSADTPADGQEASVRDAEDKTQNEEVPIGKVSKKLNKSFKNASDDKKSEPSYGFFTCLWSLMFGAAKKKANYEEVSQAQNIPEETASEKNRKEQKQKWQSREPYGAKFADISQAFNTLSSIFIAISSFFKGRKEKKSENASNLGRGMFAKVPSREPSVNVAEHGQEESKSSRVCN